MKYKIIDYNIYGFESNVIFSSNDKNEIVKKMEELEGGEYSQYMDYVQHCVDNYEEIADYCPSYLISVEGSNVLYSIEDIPNFTRYAD